MQYLVKKQTETRNSIQVQVRQKVMLRRVKCKKREDIITIQNFLENTLLQLFL